MGLVWSGGIIERQALIQSLDQQIQELVIVTGLPA